jgi:transposase
VATSVDHRMVWRRARPGRAAVLVPSPAGDWLPIAKRALCSLSLTWGGMGDILIPVGADNRPSPAFRAVLRAHDPDYVAAYEATSSEIALADPSAYAAWRAGSAGSSDDSEDETTLRQQFEAEMSGLRATWDPSVAIGFARSWCSPYPSPKGGYYPVAREFYLAGQAAHCAVGIPRPDEPPSGPGSWRLRPGVRVDGQDADRQLGRCRTSRHGPPDVTAKTAQKHDYPSTAHRRSYARRTGAERGFATAKDPVGFPSYRGDIALKEVGAMAETRRKFDRDFREGAVRLVRETGKPIAQVARDLGINPGTLGNWVNADRDRRGGDGALGEDERAELARLRRENAELAMRCDVLKRSVALWVQDAMGR